MKPEHGEEKKSFGDRLYKKIADNTSNSRYGLKTFFEPENTIVDIIFVHGLTGHRDHTWSMGKHTTPWPQAFLPQKIPQARILTFGYDATIIGLRSISGNRLGDHAKNLLAALATLRAHDKNINCPIIFVAHSLGGLVCEDALLASKASPEEHLRTTYNCTKAILFMGTPHSGTILATVSGRLARLINPITRTNLRIVNILRRDSEVLARIQNEFHSLLRRHDCEGYHSIEITCFYEEVPLPAVGMVVPKHSAILPGYTAIGIHKNHRDMARFDSENDPGFISVLGELQRWVTKIKSQESNLCAIQTFEPSHHDINNSIDVRGITIWGNIEKSNIVGGNQTIHGGLTFLDS